MPVRLELHRTRLTKPVSTATCPEILSQHIVGLRTPPRSVTPPLPGQLCQAPSALSDKKCFLILNPNLPWHNFRPLTLILSASPQSAPPPSLTRSRRHPEHPTPALAPFRPILHLLSLPTPQPSRCPPPRPQLPSAALSPPGAPPTERHLSASTRHLLRARLHLWLWRVRAPPTGHAQNAALLPRLARFPLVSREV